MADNTGTTTTTKKVLGWGKCTLNGMSDIVERSTSLEVEEGDVTEAKIEGGTDEGRKHGPDKYKLTCNRRIGSASDVKVGYKESVDSVAVVPENTGAVGVTLSNPSQHIAVKFDSTDGLVAVYTWETKGHTDTDGNIDDITFQAKA